MKKTVLMLLLLFVLAGCSTSSSTPENSTAALTTHTHTTYHTEIDGEFLLYSNGSTVMGTKLYNLDRTFYQVEFSDTTPKYTELFTLKDLGGTSLVICAGAPEWEHRFLPPYTQISIMGTFCIPHILQMC